MVENMSESKSKSSASWQKSSEEQSKTRVDTGRRYDSGRVETVSSDELDLRAFGNAPTAEAIALKIIHRLKDYLMKEWYNPLADDEKLDSALLGLDRLKDPKRSACAQCGKEDNRSGSVEMRWCGGCYALRYCSKECQRKAWKAGHNKQCSDDLKLLSWREHYYAACRMFNMAFRMMLANVRAKQDPLESRYHTRQKYRAWAARLVCEEIGAMVARESARVIYDRIGESRLTRFCLAVDCTSPSCIEARKKFEDKGMKVQLGFSYRKQIFDAHDKKKEQKQTEQ
jgi:hypothetical protein